MRKWVEDFKWLPWLALIFAVISVVSTIKYVFG